LLGLEIEYAGFASPQTIVTPVQWGSGADSIRHEGHVAPTFTNGWARGQRE